MFSINKLNNLLLKHLVAVLLIIGAHGIVAAQSSLEEIPLTKEELAWIEKHPVLRASSNTTLAPFDFMSAGHPIGLSIDYLNLVGTKVGFKIKYINIETWNKTLEMLENKEIDLMHTISKNEEREKNLNFSAPYYYMPIVNFGSVDSQRINSVSDLEGKNIGILRGHIIGETYKEKYPLLNLVEFENHSEIINALALGEIDVYTAGADSVLFLIAQNNIRDLEIIGNDFVLENNLVDQRIAVHKDNQILMDIINKGLAAISDEEVRSISDKWLQSNQGFKLTFNELDWLANNKVIKVAAVQEAFPYEFIDKEGKVSGISGDFLNEIAKRLNVTFVWAGNKTWDEGLLKIRTRDADVVSGITPTKERQSFLNFSDSYFNLQNVIISRDDSTVFSNINTLNGRTIAQVKGTAIIGYLSKNYPNIKVVETKTRQEALELVSTGNVDAMIEDVTAALGNITKYGFENLSIVGTTPYTEAMAIGISSELPLLSSAIQKALTNIGPETSSVIFTKWLTQRIKTKIDYGPLLYIFGAVSLGIIFVLIWNRKLVLARKEADTSKKAAEVSKKIAEKASAAKSIFLASMSHDLRTPLNAIIGFSEAMLEGTFGSIKNNKHAEYVDDIHTSGKYLLQLVNDILDLSALEAGKRELIYESFDGQELILECKNIIFKLAEDKNIDIAIISESHLHNVYADRHAVKQILMNLISNSIKFSPSNGKITIKSVVSHDNYIFQVIDKGCGISQEAIKMVSMPFTKDVQSPFISHEEGAGLGLSIVKSLVDVHGGEFSIESALGEGTTITVSLPLPKDQQIPFPYRPKILLNKVS